MFQKVQQPQNSAAAAEYMFCKNEMTVKTIVFSLAIAEIAPALIVALVSIVVGIIGALYRPIVLSFSMHTKKGKEVVECYSLPTTASLDVIFGATLIFISIYLISNK
jgi:hypothetical protein